MKEWHVWWTGTTPQSALVVHADRACQAAHQFLIDLAGSLEWGDTISVSTSDGSTMGRFRIVTRLEVVTEAENNVGGL